MQGVADLGRRVTSVDSQAEEKRVAEDRSDGGVVAATGAKLLRAEQRNFDTFYAAHRDQMARALSLSLRNPDLGAEAADEAFVGLSTLDGSLNIYEPSRVGLPRRHELGAFVASTSAKRKRETPLAR